MPPAQIFQLQGVTVDVSIFNTIFYKNNKINLIQQLHNSTDRVIVLENVNLSSSGRYRCEVSGEAPSFQTVSDHGLMTVVGKFVFFFYNYYDPFFII